MKFKEAVYETNEDIERMLKKHRYFLWVVFFILLVTSMSFEIFSFMMPDTMLDIFKHPELQANQLFIIANTMYFFATVIMFLRKHWLQFILIVLLSILKTVMIDLDLVTTLYIMVDAIICLACIIHVFFKELKNCINDHR